MTASIRRAGLSDGEALSELAQRTFRETFVEDFAIPYPAADLAVFVPQTYGVAAWAATLADPACACWIAEAENQAVGYALAGPCTLPYAQAHPAQGELKRLYVRRDAQGLGLGTRLMDAALAWLELGGRRPIWIGVWCGNARAQRFYAGYGFEKIGAHTFPVGGWIDHEVALRRD